MQKVKHQYDELDKILDFVIKQQKSLFIILQKFDDNFDIHQPTTKILCHSMSFQVKFNRYTLKYLSICIYIMRVHLNLV